MRWLLPSNPMKINILIPVLGPSGGIRVIYEITNRLQERHDVVLYYPALPPRTRILKGVSSTVYSAASAFKRTFSHADWMEVNAPIKKVPCFNKGCQPLLQRQIRDADVLVATSWPTAYTAHELPPSKGKPYYFMQHYEIWPIWDELSCWKKPEEFSGPPSVAMADVTPEDPYLSRYKRLVDESYSLPLDIIYTSEWEAKVLSRLGESAIGSVSYGIDKELFYPSVSSDQTGILALYRNSPEKGDEQAISAFKRLHERYPDIEYLMFGRKKSKSIPRFVNFYEDPSQETIRALYSLSDIFVYPSWVEGYGMPPMEAMACGNAIVSTDVGAVRDYSPEDGVEFVPVRDVNAIVNSVEELLSSDRIERMKKSNINHIQQYTWEQTATQFESAILR